ncbi:MAG TPA: phosphoribosylformylglycinamidine cyclo-ligase [Firmicutes bacterium]|nr:phosphoribosylformylglycinamidine cyclo-ligase [Bacillota bacterium]
MPPLNPEISYRQAGVDIEAGDRAVERIKGMAASTFRREVLQDLGGFGGLFAPNLSGYRCPVLVAGCDGVGTKLKIAFTLGKHDTVGLDCVAMCVNDILAQGADPLFFLDYLAVGKLIPEQVERIVSGVAGGCRLAGCALLGGETAEMPGFYPEGEYDLAGFAVGIVEKDNLVDGSRISPGDIVIGLASTGMHSNGYSLARRVLLEQAGLVLEDAPRGWKISLGEELLRPTRIYVPAVKPLLGKYSINGAAHITGGGLVGNLPRILRPGLQVVLREGSWPVPPVFELIERLGPVSRKEMYRVFNMGIGFALVISPDQSKELMADLSGAGAEVAAWEIGRVTVGTEPAVVIER